VTDRTLMNSNDRLRRLGRLTLKELREILRDRRTIVTLLLMPLLLYPLMSIAFQQFFVSQLSTTKSPRYRLAFESGTDAQYLVHLLREGNVHLVEMEDEKGLAAADPARPVFEVATRESLAEGIEEYEIHLGLRLKSTGQLHFDPRHDLEVTVEILYLKDWIASRDAAAIIENALTVANEKFLSARLKNLGVRQPAAPVHVVRQTVKEVGAASGAVSITAVVPFILILMTVTGAVYPAIDLTAGERERGTLEILVAAPIPRVGVLLAKYVAVLAVALLTAIANLTMMTITVSVGGLGRLLFGDAGISPGILAAVFGLLLLFAAFFSAVLLAITSSARSFKEAQAYLIPLMLLALGPGVLGLMPGVELSGLLLVTPLANIVLLGRDLFALKASGSATLIVVTSTLLYAATAIGVAARIFGAESVLYSTHSGWADLVRRPREPQPAPTVTSAGVCLAVMFPAYFFALGAMEHLRGDILGQQIAGAVMTAVIFGGIPLAAMRARRVAIAPVFRLPDSPPLAFGAALVLGLSFWVIGHEAVVSVQQFRELSLVPKFMELVQEYVAQLRTLPAAVVVLTMAVTPAIFEELFFRGFLLPALRTRTSPVAAIVLSAVAFGLFHGINPNPLAAERVLSSTLVGVLLGWVRWRTGTVLPGIVLHGVNNALLILLVYYEPQLTAAGIGLSREQHLPAGWIAGGAMGIVAGAALMFVATRRPAERAT
jgi:sodium transport system permease protein